MTDVGRRSYLIFSLPAPAFSLQSTAPLQFALARDSQEIVHNNKARRWWQERTLMNTQVRELQTLTIKRDKVTPIAELYRRAVDALKQTEAALSSWLEVFRNVYARVNAIEPFVPCWVTLTPLNDYAVYDFDAPPTKAPTETRHTVASIVFETVCLYYLRCALQQQCALFAHLAHQKRCQSDELDAIPEEPYITRMLEMAIGGLKELTDKILPLHFSTLNGQESYLISVHFYLHFLARLLRAQEAYNTALDWHRASATPANEAEAYQDVCLVSSAFFAHSGQLVERARKTSYSNQLLLGTLAQHRLAAALTRLSQAFNAADKSGLAGWVLRYKDGAPAGLDMCQVLATEAYYCARAAVALNSQTEPIRRMFKDFTTRVTGMYSLAPPDDTELLTGPSESIADGVRLSGGGSHATNWCNEFGHIEIVVNFTNGTRGVVATHGCPMTKVLSLGLTERRFVIDCSTNLCKFSS